MKSMVVNIHEAKTHLSRLLEQVSRGEDVVIAKAGVPKVRLVAIPEAGRRQPGQFHGWIEWAKESFAPLTEREMQEWE